MTWKANKTPAIHSYVVWLWLPFLAERYTTFITIMESNLRSTRIFLVLLILLLRVPL